MAIVRQWDRHSKLVFWGKILLPLAAISILSTLFLVSHNIRPEDALPYADVDIATLIKEPRLTAPVFAGMTADGGALSLKASEAKVGSADGTTAGKISDLLGVLDTPDGASTHLYAKEAAMNQSTKLALLTGGVQITNSIGYRIDSQVITLSLDKTIVDSPGTVIAQGPVGKITAGSMHFGLAGGIGSQYVLLFKGGVSLLYQPTQGRAKN